MITFKTGTFFTLNGKTCKVTNGSRVNVAYVSAAADEEPTFHTAKRETLVNFAAAGLITD